jgi:hypothetical protein
MYGYTPDFNITLNSFINNIPKELQSCELLNKEILAEEVVLALRFKKKKKSCGPDGILELVSRYFSNLL